MGILTIETIRLEVKVKSKNLSGGQVAYPLMVSYTRLSAKTYHVKIGRCTSCNLVALLLRLLNSVPSELNASPSSHSRPICFLKTNFRPPNQVYDNAPSLHHTSVLAITTYTAYNPSSEASSISTTSLLVSHSPPYLGTPLSSKRQRHA